MDDVVRRGSPKAERCSVGSRTEIGTKKPVASRSRPKPHAPAHHAHNASPGKARVQPAPPTAWLSAVARLLAAVWRCAARPARDSADVAQPTPAQSNATKAQAAFPNRIRYEDDIRKASSAGGEKLWS